MNLPIICLVGLILGPLWAYLRGMTPTALFAIAALIFALTAAIDLGSTKMVLSSVDEANSYQSYSVRSGGFESLFSSLVMAILAGLTWLQTRCGAMRYPSLTKAFFWMFHLGLIGHSIFPRALLVIFPMPRRYIDYPEFFEIFTGVSNGASFLSLIGLLGISSLLVMSAVLRWWAVNR